MATSKKPELTEEEQVRQFLLSQGATEKLLDAEPPSISEIIQDGDDPMSWTGADYRPDLMRYSWVANDAQVERLLRQDFFVVQGDVRLRGVPGGIVMGRLLKDERAHQAARRKRDHQRRAGVETRQGPVGAASHGGAGFNLERHNQQVERPASAEA